MDSVEVPEDDGEGWGEEEVRRVDNNFEALQMQMIRSVNQTRVEAHGRQGSDAPWSG